MSPTADVIGAIYDPASGERPWTEAGDLLASAVGADPVGTGNWYAEIEHRADLGSRCQSHAGMAKIGYRF